jgi:hypothetical protein
VHLAVKPLPTVDFAVWPSIYSDATYLVFNERTFVHAPVSNFENSLSLFHAFLILAFILRSIWPFFNAIAMLLVVFPLSLVAGSVRFDAGTLSAHFVVQPGSFESRPI